VKGEKINLFPNPATNKLTLQYTMSLESYKISNIQGVEVLSGSLSQPETSNIDVSNLPIGTYIIALYGLDKKTTYLKLAKN
jgi:hypothetical protein